MMVVLRELAIDRISDLPCSLLTHILSLLTTEEAVQTCILSKRWRNVWATLPILKFDDSKFSEHAVSEEEYRECEAKFMRFVEGVLTYREILPLDTFKLSWRCYNNHNCDQVFEFLIRAAECMPRVISISICICTDAFFDLPAPIFTSVSVEEMSLSVRNLDDRDYCIEPKSINLLALKKLELGDLKINETFIGMLFSGCPLLEELVMNGCHLDFGEISSDMLKKLVLNECIISKRMQISCRVLVYLLIKCPNRGGIILKNMCSLVNGDVSFEHPFGGEVDYPFEDDLKLLSGLPNVTNLRLHMICYFDLDKLIIESSNCPPFNNLTRLTLKDLNLNYNWHLVDWFLQHSPNLKKLTLHFCQPDEDALEEEFERALSIRKIQREYLETVVIIGYYEMSTKFASELVSTLGTLVKQIGRITII